MSNILCTQVSASTAANSKRTKWIRFDAKETGHKKQRYKKRTRRLLEVYLVRLHRGSENISAKKSRDDRTLRARFEHYTNKLNENEYDAMRNIKVVQLQSYDSHYSFLRCVFLFGLTWMIRVYQAVELWKECMKAFHIVSVRIVWYVTIFYSFEIPVLTIYPCAISRVQPSLALFYLHTPTEFLFVSCIFNAFEMLFSAFNIQPNSLSTNLLRSFGKATSFRIYPSIYMVSVLATTDGKKEHNAKRTNVFLPQNKMNWNNDL